MELDRQKNIGLFEAFVRLWFQGQWRFVMWSFGLKFHVGCCVGINASEAHNFICGVEYVSSILIHNFGMYDIFTRLQSAITHETTMSFFFRFSYIMPVSVVTIYRAQRKRFHILHLWFRAKRTALVDFMLFTHRGLLVEGNVYDWVYFSFLLKLPVCIHESQNCVEMYFIN
jgi:hypothetical protein